MDNTERELTDAEVARIDLLHSATDNYLAEILAMEGGYVRGEYNMRLINQVLDAVWAAIEPKGWVTEQEFYPYRESEVTK